MFLIKKSKLQLKKGIGGDVYVFRNSRVHTNINQKEEDFYCETCFFYGKEGCKLDETCESEPLEDFNFLDPFFALIKKSRF